MNLTNRQITELQDLILAISLNEDENVNAISDLIKDMSGTELLPLAIITMYLGKVSPIDSVCLLSSLEIPDELVSSGLKEANRLVQSAVQSRENIE